MSNIISNVLLKVHATDRAKLMLTALEAGMGKTEKKHKPKYLSTFKIQNLHRLKWIDTGVKLLTRRGEVTHPLRRL